MGLSLNSYAIPNADKIYEWWGIKKHKIHKIHQDSYLLNKEISLSQCLRVTLNNKLDYEPITKDSYKDLKKLKYWGLMLHSGHKKSARQHYYSNKNSGNIKPNQGFYASVVPYIITEKGKKHLLIPIIHENFHSGLPVKKNQKINKYKNIGYIPSCKSLNNLPSIIKTNYEKMVAYYPTINFRFNEKENRPLGTIQNKIKNGAEIILTQNVIDSGTDLNYLKLKHFINKNKPNQQFPVLKDYNIKSYCFAGINCQDKNTSPIKHTVNNDFDWLKGKLCNPAIEYQYKITHYKKKSKSEWLLGKPNTLTNVIALKLEQIIENESLPKNVEFKLDKNNKIAANFKSKLLSPMSFVIKQGQKKVSNVKHYQQLSNCYKDSNSTNLQTANACSAVKIDNKCKLSKILTKKSITSRIFNFPPPPLKISFPLVWGEPVSISNCNYLDKKSMTKTITLSCNSQPTLKWKYYKPLKIIESKVLSLSDLTLNTDLLKGRNFCDQEYEYTVIKNNSQNIYPIQLLLKNVKTELEFNFLIRQSDKKEDIITRLKNKSIVIKGKIIDTQNKQHQVQLLNKSNLHLCKEAAFIDTDSSYIFQRPNNQVQRYPLLNTTFCPKFTKIDNISSSCQEIKNQSFEFKFKQFRCTEKQKRHLIIVERNEKFKDSARMIRQVILEQLSKKMDKNDEIPSFDLVALENGAKLILRCEDLEQSIKPVNALLSELKTTLNKELLFDKKITRNPLDNFKYVNSLDLEIYNNKSILYINGGEQMTTFSEYTFNHGENSRLDTYTRKYKIPIYFLQKNDDDCKKIKEYTFSKNCKKVTKKNIIKFLNKLFN